MIWMIIFPCPFVNWSHIHKIIKTLIGKDPCLSINAWLGLNLLKTELEHHG
jgi:hypothetical protein